MTPHLTYSRRSSLSCATIDNNFWVHEKSTWVMQAALNSPLNVLWSFLQLQFRGWNVLECEKQADTKNVLILLILLLSLLLNLFYASKFSIYFFKYKSDWTSSPTEIIYTPLDEIDFIFFIITLLKWLTLKLFPYHEYFINSICLLFMVTKA